MFWLKKRRKRREQQIRFVLEQYEKLDSSDIAQLTGLGIGCYSDIYRMENNGQLEKVWDEKPRVIQEYPVRHILMPRCKFRIVL